MKALKILGLTALTAVSMSVAVEAHPGKGMDPVTRYDVMTNEKLRSKLSESDIINLHKYFDYQEREQCQKYITPPAGFVVKDCELTHHHYRGNVVNISDVHFDLGSSKLGEHEKQKIGRIAKQIKDANAKKVMVSGYTDTVGSAAKNVALSKKRAHVVTKELAKHDIKASVINEKAYGETKQKVKTDDNKSARVNRRVEILFTR